MGTRSLTSPKFEVKISATSTHTLTDASASSIPQPSLNYSKTLTNGINASEADRSWQSKSRVLVNGGSEVIDLYDFAGIDIGAGAGLDGHGQAIANEKLVAIAIVNDNAVTEPGVLHVEPDPTAGFTALGSHTAANGGALAGQGIIFKANPHVNGFDIVDGVNHRLRMTATSGSVSYSIYLLARSDNEGSSSSSSSLSSSSSSSISSSSLSSSSLSSSLSSQSTSSSSISTSSISTSSLSSSSISTSSSSLSSSSLSSSSLSSSSSSISTSSLSSSSSLSSLSSSSSSQSP